MSRQNEYRFETRLRISPSTLQFLEFVESDEIVTAQTLDNVEFELDRIEFEENSEKYNIRAIKKTGVSEVYHTNDIIAETDNQYVIKCIN
jgi:hypothetical protein